MSLTKNKRFAAQQRRLMTSLIVMGSLVLTGQLAFASAPLPSGLKVNLNISVPKSLAAPTGDKELLEASSVTVNLALVSYLYHGGVNYYCPLMTEVHTLSDIKKGSINLTFANVNYTGSNSRTFVGSLGLSGTNDREKFNEILSKDFVALNLSCYNASNTTVSLTGVTIEKNSPHYVQVSFSVQNKASEAFNVSTLMGIGSSFYSHIAEASYVDKLINGIGKYFNYMPNGVACTDGQVLKWDNANSRWLCATDSGSSGVVTSVAGRAGDVVLTASDITSGLSAVATSGAYADLSGKPALGGSALLNVGTVAGTVAAGNDSRFTDSRAPNGAAGGDLAGSYPNPTINSIKGVNVDFTGLASGNILKYDGTKWAPSSDLNSGGTVTSVSSSNAYISIANGTSTPAITLNVGQVANTVAAGDDSRFTDSRAPSGTAGGDLAGTYPNPTVNNVGVDKISSISGGLGLYFTYKPNNVACLDGQVLKWVTANLRWECAADGGSTGVVTSVTASAPLVSSGGATPNLSMAQATGSADGYLSSGDWTTFNSKQAGNTELTGLGSIALTGIVQRTAAGAYTGLGLTAPLSVTGTDIGMTQANTTTPGFLSAADWNTFNGKQNALGFTPLDPANNLSDLNNIATARTNLGLGGAAVLSVGTTAGTVAAGNDSRFTDSRAPSGTAGGDLAGTYPNPTVSNVGVDKISSGLGLYLSYKPNNANCSNGEVLKWATDKWICSTDDSGGMPSTNVVASGGSVNLSLSKVHLLNSVGGATITLSNMVNGGTYTLIVADTTSRTYTFSGCNNSYFSPANDITSPGAQSVYGIMTVDVSGTWKCYISWASDFN